MGPPAGQPAGGEGAVDVRANGLYLAGAGWPPLEHLRSSPPSLSVILPAPQPPPCLQEIQSSMDLLWAGWGEAWSWGGQEAWSLQSQENYAGRGHLGPEARGSGEPLQPPYGA